MFIFDFTCLAEDLVLFQVFCVLQRRYGLTDVDSSSLHFLSRCLFLSDHVASFALRRASVHLYFSSLPIDLWVVVLEPGVAKDHALLSKTGDGKERPFGVSFITEDYIHHFGDLTCLVRGAVYVVYQYRARDAPGTHTFCMDKIFIYEVIHSSGV